MGDLPYASTNPPKYTVELKSDAGAERRFYVKTIENDEVLPDELPIDSEKRNILIEAYRGMRNCFGNVLFFSEPVPASSFVFRSEREFLQRYDERFAWSVHFFQCAIRDGRQSPERYAGLLFIRPWHIHVREALKEEPYKTQFTDADPSELTPEQLYFSPTIPADYVPAPAICEGYLRPPLSLLRSPFFSQCLDFYASPYGVTPFLSIPFFASQFGATCGHCCAATSFLMSKTKTVLSPYELAVATSGVTAKGRQLEDEAKGDSEPIAYGWSPLFAISKLVITALETVAKVRCHARAKVEYYFAPGYHFGKGRAFSPNHEAEFSGILCSYLYQGIPVLYLVDPDRLYAQEDDDTILSQEVADSYTPLKRCHVILIHSIVRANDLRRHGFVFSDATDLHLKGSIFHRASISRLWAARFRPDPESIPSGMLSPSIPPEQYRANNQCAAVFTVCLPNEFAKTYTAVRGESVKERLSRIYKEKKIKSPENCQVFLRDRSQLRGFLLHHIFQEQYLTRTTVPGFVSEERKLREYLRMIDIPPYVWIIQEATEKASVHGSILDIREDSQFRGEYDTQDQSVTIFGTTKDGIPATISMYKRDNKVEAKIETRAAYVGGPQRSGGGVT